MCKKYRWLIAASLTALALSGCGSGDDQATVATGAVNTGNSVVYTMDSKEVAVGADSAALAGACQGTSIVGADTCVACHSDPQLCQGKDVANTYLASKHVIHDTVIDQQTAQTKGCNVCHDPIGDGPLLAPLLDPDDVPAGGLAAVTCEVCHGAGGEHGGRSPLPDPTPDYQLCGECHGALPDLAGAQHSVNLFAKYQAGKHYRSAVRNSSVCMRCHSDEGFRTYIGETSDLDYLDLVDAMADKPDVGTAPIQCRTCHDPHSGQPLVAATVVDKDSNGHSLTDANGNRISVQVFSSQFNLCTSCHQAFLNYSYNSATDLFAYELDGSRPPYFHVFTIAPSYDDPTINRSLTIWDTHFKYIDPSDGLTVLINGYGINAAAEDACTRCHDPHATTTDINPQ
jgi:hypothetical protein